MGMFDGIHLGHRIILEGALRQSKELNAKSVVFGFANHPQTLLSQTPTRLLSTLEERLETFKTMGFDEALILEFNEALMTLPAADFMTRILQDYLHVKGVSVGYDYRFGQGRQGDVSLLKAFGEDHGIDVQVIDPVRADEQIVSSTVIRKLLAYGDLDQANQLLGRPYSVSGIVEKGTQRGQTIGFPTANLAMDTQRLLPGEGTYGGAAEVEGTVYPAVCNVGLAPTFGEMMSPRVEVHVLDYHGQSFYGEPLRFWFCQRIRDEQTFSSVDDLVAQIHQDIAVVREQHFEKELANLSGRATKASRG